MKVKIIGLKDKIIEINASTANDIIDHILKHYDVEPNTIKIKRNGKSIDNESSVSSKDKIIVFVKKAQNKDIKEEVRKQCTINECNFWGTSKTNWLCSVHFKKHIDEKCETPASTSEKTEPKPRIKTTDTSICYVCSKRVGLLGFVCKCENIFCAKHRQPHLHECKANHTSSLKRKLENSLGDAKPNKIQTF